MSEEMIPTLAQGGLVGAALAIGAFLLRWRTAGYKELVETCDRQGVALDKAAATIERQALALDQHYAQITELRSQMTTLHERINTGHRAITNAEDRAAASELRAANAEAGRLLIEKRYGEEVAELRAEIEVLRQQIKDAGLVPASPPIKRSRSQSA